MVACYLVGRRFGGARCSTNCSEHLDNNFTTVHWTRLPLNASSFAEVRQNSLQPL